MLRIAISCGEGFSSGFLAHHLQEQVNKANDNDLVSFIRIPFDQLYERQDEVDIAMIMPHIEWKAKESKKHYDIPLYVIPFKVAIKPTYLDFYQDAQDIMDMANGTTGLMSFPEEKNTGNVTRLVSHRNWIQSQSARI